MNTVRAAIFDILERDEWIRENTNGVYWKTAPSGTETPYVIVRKQVGTDDNTFAGPPLETDVWVVKGVGEADDAEDISDRCFELLHRTRMTIEGKRHAGSILAQGSFDYDETTDGERFDHAGRTYRFTTEVTT